MTLLPGAVERLAQIGANIEITDRTNYLPQSIENIIRIAVGKGAHVTIEVGNYLPQSPCPVDLHLPVGGVLQ